MTLSQSPSIVRNGLVFYYDMSNVKKSFKGMPTTNVLTYPDANWTGSAFSLTYNYDATTTDSKIYVTEVSNPINAAGVLRYSTGTSGYKFWALRGTVPSAGTYTFSYYARISSGSSSNLNNAQLWRNTDVDGAVTGDWNPTYTNEWKRYVTTGTVTSYLDYFPIHNNPISAGYTIDYCGFQLEAGSVASPWINGTRSNTQSLIDLTGNTTLTASSLTYASDNTFSFNGSSNLIIAPENSVFNTQTPTVSVWFKPSLTTQNGFLFEKGNVNTQYSLFQESGYIVWRQLLGSGLTNLVLNPTSSYFSTSSWGNVTATFNASNGVRKIYANGILAASDTVTPSAINTNTNGISIGVYGGYNGGRAYWYAGSIGAISVYSVELTSDQVKKNFNALRGRYGL